MPEQEISYFGYQLPGDLVAACGIDPQSVDALGRAQHQGFRDHLELTSEDRVFQFCSMLGIDAIAIAETLGERGRFVGVDVNARMVDWCNAHVRARTPQVTFHHFDARDPLLNPMGSALYTDFVAPIGDGEADIVIFHSVFTHMFQWEVEHLLKEARRILSPRGRIWASFFLLNPAILAHLRLAPAQNGLSFATPYGNRCRVEHVDQPRLAVAYEEDLVNEMVAGSGLAHFRPPLRGVWSGCASNPEAGQDVLILRRA